MKYSIVLLSLLLLNSLLWVGAANGKECKPEDVLNSFPRTPAGNIDTGALDISDDAFNIRRGRQMREMLSGFGAFEEKKASLPPKLTGKIELEDDCFFLFDISVLDIDISQVTEDSRKSFDDPQRIVEIPVNIPPNAIKADIVFETLMKNETDANSAGARRRETTAGNMLSQILRLLEFETPEGPEKEGKNVCFRQTVRGTIDHIQGYEAGGIETSIHLKLKVFGFAKCCCPEAISDVSETPAPGPTDQIQETPPTQITPTLPPEPTEEDIGTGGGAGSVPTGGAPSLPSSINLTSRSCTIELVLPSMIGSGFSLLTDVAIDDTTPDAIGITTTAIDTVDLKFLDATGSQVLQGQSRRPSPPQRQSIFPRDLSGNVLRDAGGKIVEIVLTSVSRDRVELQIPTDLGRISGTKRIIIFILRDPGAGGFRVAPDRVPGVGLICHFE